MSRSDSGHDIERGAPENEKKLPQVPEDLGDVSAVQVSLQDLQAELNEFLAAHAEKTVSLQASLSSAEREAAQAQINMQASVQDTEFSSPTSEKSQRIIQLQSTGSSIADTSRAVDAHADQLKDFLSSIFEISVLFMMPFQCHLRRREALAHPRTKVAILFMVMRAIFSNDTIEQNLSESDNVKAYQSLTEQFNTLVVISTFTASLIVAFLSLAKSIMLDDHRVAFDIGMLLALFAMSAHFGTIIVAGRGAALTSQHAATGQSACDLKWFRLYLELCEQLQTIATILFIVVIFQLTFFMFDELEYPLILLGVALFAGLIVFWSVYWRVSITFRNIKFLAKNFRSLRFRSVDHRRHHSTP